MRPLRPKFALPSVRRAPIDSRVVRSRPVTLRSLPARARRSAASSSAARRPVILITGLSGAGRGTALRALEDAGYVAIDNLPLAMVDALLRSPDETADDAYPIAIGI